MEDNDYCCRFPVIASILLTALWLLAGQGFFADQLIPVKYSDTLTEAQTNAQIKITILGAAANTRDWMANNLMAWPQNSTLTFATAVRLAVHPFLHVGILCSIVMIISFGLYGLLFESKNGANRFLIFFLIAAVVNAVALYCLKPEGPLFGSWPFLAAFAASLLCGSNGSFDPVQSLLTRILALLAIVGLYLDWPAQIFGTPVVWQQWLPTATLGVVVGLKSWLPANEFRV